jgi:cytochrome bd-type quinol oxidase subunit 1
MVATTMIGFTVLYGFLAVIEFGLIARTIQVGPAPSEEVLNINSTGGDSDRTLTMAY